MFFLGGRESVEFRTIIVKFLPSITAFVKISAEKPDRVNMLIGTILARSCLPF